MAIDIEALGNVDPSTVLLETLLNAFNERQHTLHLMRITLGGAAAPVQYPAFIPAGDLAARSVWP